MQVVTEGIQYAEIECAQLSDLISHQIGKIPCPGLMTDNCTCHLFGHSSVIWWSGSWSTGKLTDGQLADKIGRQ